VSNFTHRLRRGAGALLVDSFFQALSKAGRLHPSANPRRHNVDVIRDVAYTGSGLAEHRLDVYHPSASALDRFPRPWPVVLYIHGGGFRILSKDTHWIMGLAYARQGYLVFNISYRLAPQNPFPAAIADACSAYAWVAQNAERYGGDLGRFVVAGESAGANLTASIALCASYERPEAYAAPVWKSGLSPTAVVPACGIFQVTDTERFIRRKTTLPSFIGDRLLEVSDAYLHGHGHRPAPRPDLELADPLLVLERGDKPARPLPSFFLPVGTRDPLLDDTRRLKVALDRLGVPCEARYYEGEVHAFHAMIMRANARLCWRDTYAFLDQHLKK
jgi:acetyl esterase